MEIPIHHIEGPMNLKYKTRLCTHFVRGRCELGVNCLFAHDQAELRDAPAVPVVCTRWLKGMCKRGDRCKDLHYIPGETTAQPNPFTQVSNPSPKSSTSSYGAPSLSISIGPLSSPGPSSLHPHPLQNKTWTNILTTQHLVNGRHSANPNLSSQIQDMRLSLPSSNLSPYHSFKKPMEVPSTAGNQMRMSNLSTSYDGVRASTLSNHLATMYSANELIRSPLLTNDSYMYSTPSALSANCISGNTNVSYSLSPSCTLLPYLLEGDASSNVAEEDNGRGLKTSMNTTRHTNGAQKSSNGGSKKNNHSRNGNKNNSSKLISKNVNEGFKDIINANRGYINAMQLNNSNMGANVHGTYVGVHGVTLGANGNYIGAAGTGMGPTGTTVKFNNAVIGSNNGEVNNTGAGRSSLQRVPLNMMDEAYNGNGETMVKRHSAGIGNNRSVNDLLQNTVDTVLSSADGAFDHYCLSDLKSGDTSYKIMDICSTATPSMNKKDMNFQESSYISACHMDSLPPYSPVENVVQPSYYSEERAMVSERASATMTSPLPVYSSQSMVSPFIPEYYHDMPSPNHLAQDGNINFGGRESNITFGARNSNILPARELGSFFQRESSIGFDRRQGHGPQVQPESTFSQDCSPSFHKRSSVNSYATPNGILYQLHENHTAELQELHKPTEPSLPSYASENYSNNQPSYQKYNEKCNPRQSLKSFQGQYDGSLEFSQRHTFCTAGGTSHLPTSFMSQSQHLPNLSQVAQLSLLSRIDETRVDAVSPTQQSLSNVSMNVGANNLSQFYDSVQLSHENADSTSFYEKQYSGEKIMAPVDNQRKESPNTLTAGVISMNQMENGGEDAISSNMGREERGRLSWDRAPACPPDFFDEEYLQLQAASSQAFSRKW